MYVVNKTRGRWRATRRPLPREEEANKNKNKAERTHLEAAAGLLEGTGDDERRAVVLEVRFEFLARQFGRLALVGTDDRVAAALAVVRLRVPQQQQQKQTQSNFSFPSGATFDCLRQPLVRWLVFFFWFLANRFA